MQLRRSPGGSMLKSLRSRPEEPPSSVTVTTAARSAIEPGSRVGLPGRRHMAAQPAQQRGEPGAAADGHHAQRLARERCACRGGIDEAQLEAVLPFVRSSQSSK